ncbi:double zinc ribbon domain-containing protein [Pseudomonas sp. S1Bt23]|uniref:double zinc ribbon domain-containing protein n=1 Tax=Pseudomonas sp. S1Bt23 TaxID=3095074 RepID=UPI002A598DAE|nr:zinc ribbon domain-containing protein [Pseudomonas sp. S1Bt23]WPO49155.1 zinc ribbon domain-containing protein [Pseudomonas sp. S1Bt23]
MAGTFELHDDLRRSMGHDRQPSRVFCLQCGTSLQPAVCRQCGNTLAAGARFCAQCGGAAG